MSTSTGSSSDFMDVDETDAVLIAKADRGDKLLADYRAQSTVLRACNAPALRLLCRRHGLSERDTRTEMFLRLAKWVFDPHIFLDHS